MWCLVLLNSVHPVVLTSTLMNNSLHCTNVAAVTYKLAEGHFFILIWEDKKTRLRQIKEVSTTMKYRLHNGSAKYSLRKQKLRLYSLCLLPFIKLKLFTSLESKRVQRNIVETRLPQLHKNSQSGDVFTISFKRKIIRKSVLSRAFAKYAQIQEKTKQSSSFPCAYFTSVNQY